MENIRKRKGEEKMEKRFKQEGITLIALVITSIVLIILAGVSISIIIGEGGLIKQAERAKSDTFNAQIESDEKLNALEEEINKAKGATTTEPETKKDIPDGEGGTIPLPNGYYYVGGIKSQGIVISDSSSDENKGTAYEIELEGNQFVWVPVEDVNEIYEIQGGEKVGKLYDFTSRGVTARAYPGKNKGFREPDIVTDSSTGDGTSYDGSSTYLNILGLTNSSDFATQLQKEFNEMIGSVEKYGGFYIGRYETGNTKTTAVVKKGMWPNTQINSTAANWYQQYVNSKSIAKANSGARSSMIWGSQWDATLKWLVSSGNKTYAEIVDSSSWGNYNGSMQTTGKNEAWVANNIYDLAGNAWDWTIEAGSMNYRVTRGGNFYYSGSDSSAFYRSNDFPSGDYASDSSRAILYIK